jgi:peptide-methionine (S)-S-oxide reductase
VDYDPSIITYEQLLIGFWNSHDITTAPFSRQYRSAIFYVNDQQKNSAIESKQKEEALLGKTVYTSIEPFTGFTLAEDYHQKYYLRQRSAIVSDLYTLYPNPADFRDSTAVTRLNGYIGGYGDADNLMKNLNKLGLSETGKKELLLIAESGLSPFCPVIIPTN